VEGNDVSDLRRAEHQPFSIPSIKSLEFLFAMYLQREMGKLIIDNNQGTIYLISQSRKF